MSKWNPVSSLSFLWRAAVRAVQAILLLLAVSAAPMANAQTYTILHDFNGCPDGNLPTSTLIFDRAGNLYGTTEYGGRTCNGYDDGVAFQLKHTESGWIFNPLHWFRAGAGGDDGAFPVDYGGLTIGPDGTIYGSTNEGGITGCGGTCSLGTIFRLQPPPTACTSALCPWTLTILYEFPGGDNGSFPNSNVVFDAAGNLYGTTQFGTVYELSPSQGGWTEQGIYNVGGELQAGIVMDSAGNLYTAGNNAVMQFTRFEGGWIRNILYIFTGDNNGNAPAGGLIFDAGGNLYGSTTRGGTLGGGTIFQLSPSGGGNWTLTTLCNFAGDAGPQSSLSMDAGGNLYGTTEYDGFFGGGSVFKATRYGNNWTCTDLYDFQQDGNGVAPIGGVTLDANGNLYGTTSGGGKYGGGTIWEITP